LDYCYTLLTLKSCIIRFSAEPTPLSVLHQTGVTVYTFLFMLQVPRMTQNASSLDVFPTIILYVKVFRVLI